MTLTGNPNSRPSRATASRDWRPTGRQRRPTQAVTLAINNLDEVAPAFTSGATAAAIDENSGAGQVVYTADGDRPATTAAVQPGDLQPGRHRCGASPSTPPPAK